MSGLKHCRTGLFEEPGKEIPVAANNEYVALPVGNRRYLQFNLTQEVVVDLFAQASISNSGEIVGNQ